MSKRMYTSGRVVAGYRSGLAMNLAYHSERGSSVRRCDASASNPSLSGDGGSVLPRLSRADALGGLKLFGSRPESHARV
ncbi:hypothetical protein Trydic_g559 [Trypoxylus dichotomus]